MKNRILTGLMGMVAVTGLTVAQAQLSSLSRVANTTLRMPNSPPGPGLVFPTNLADTGIFADLRTLIPNAGIVPYFVNAPLWSDGAIKSRWFSLPDTNLTIGFSARDNWNFPAGTVWIKHFELELTNGVPASRRRLETRVLVRNATGIYGVTYRWDDSQTSAVLVTNVNGLDEPFVLHDGGTTRTQTWRYPSRSDCLQCHRPIAGYALGFNTPQLNSDADYGEGVGVRNQIRAFSDFGYFSAPVTNFNLIAQAHETDSAWSREWRVRSYLDTHCKQCHQPGGIVPTWDARITTPLSDAGLIGRLIVPGSTNNSILLTRVSLRGPGQMPPLATSLVDTQFVALLTAWITNDLPNLGMAPPHLPVFAPPSLNPDGSIRLSIQFDPRWPYDAPMPSWTNVVEVSTDLMHWAPMLINNEPGTLQWDEPALNRRFYRDSLRGARP